MSGCCQIPCRIENHNQIKKFLNKHTVLYISYFKINKNNVFVLENQDRNITEIMESLCFPNGLDFKSIISYLQKKYHSNIFLISYKNLKHIIKSQEDLEQIMESYNLKIKPENKLICGSSYYDLPLANQAKY